MKDRKGAVVVLERWRMGGVEKMEWLLKGWKVCWSEGKGREGSEVK